MGVGGHCSRGAGMERRGRAAWLDHGFLGLIALSALHCQGAPPSGAPEQRAAIVAPSTPFRESGGVVVMEAENFTGAAPGTGSAASATWTARAVVGASGGTALEATPNAGVR